MKPLRLPRQGRSRGSSSFWIRRAFPTCTARSSISSTPSTSRGSSSTTRRRRAPVPAVIPSTEVPDPGDIDIPIVSLSLEDAADQLIAEVYGRVSEASFNHRAARDVLALSLLMRGHRHGPPSHHGLTSIRPHLVDECRWWRRCATHVQVVVAALPTAEGDLVHNELRWLTGTQLLIGTIPPWGVPAHPARAASVCSKHARSSTWP